LDELQPDGYGYCDEDSTSVLYGYGTETGTADRPNLGDSANRGAIPNSFPAPGAGTPDGTYLRSLDHGAEATFTTKEVQPDGLLNDGYKRKGAVENAVTSDPSQYEMQTSMTQRDKTREGSQAAGGRANAVRAAIKSRIVGQRVPTYSGGYRHAEMTPKSQSVVLRPFHYRTAGTGQAEQMTVNEMYVSEPRQRVPISDPYVGTSVNVDSTDGNYSDEDTLPYV
jgi:hypothetical protein